MLLVVAAANGQTNIRLADDGGEDEEEKEEDAVLMGENNRCSSDSNW